MAYTRRFLVCDVCMGRRKLWLGGGDYLECPQCDATGKVEMVAEVIKARTQERFIPMHGGGLRKYTAINMPNAGWRETNVPL